MMDVVAFRDGAGGWWVHILWSALNGSNYSDVNWTYLRYNSSHTVTNNVGSILAQPFDTQDPYSGSLDFRHELADPKVVQSSTPSLYLTWASSNGTTGLYFQKLTWNGTNWTQGTIRTIDSATPGNLQHPRYRASTRLRRDSCAHHARPGKCHGSVGGGAGRGRYHDDPHRQRSATSATGSSRTPRSATTPTRTSISSPRLMTTTITGRASTTGVLPPGAHGRWTNPTTPTAARPPPASCEGQKGSPRWGLCTSCSPRVRTRPGTSHLFPLHLSLSKQESGASRSGSGACLLSPTPAWLLRVRPLFTPASIAGIKAWWDFSDISTLYQQASPTALPVTADGQTIAVVTDKSGGGNELEQNTASYEPTYKTGIINGKSVARFDGVDNFLDATTVGADTSWTFFIVAQKRSAVTGSSQGLFPVAASANIITNSTIGAGTGLIWRNNSGSNAVAISGTSSPTNVNVIVGVVTSATAMGFYVNGGTSVGSSDPHDDVVHGYGVFARRRCWWLR